jgi:hypothetical protein
MDRLALLDIAKRGLAGRQADQFGPIEVQRLHFDDVEDAVGTTARRRHLEAGQHVLGRIEA